MTAHVVFFLEGPSEADFLKGFLPSVLPQHIQAHYQVFEGKQDLEKRLVLRMREWLLADSTFIVVRDQDSADCYTLKRDLLRLCHDAGRPDAIVRIACHELESFFLGDWEAVAQAFGKPALQGHQRKAKYRDPDRIGDPFTELARALPGYQKREGARRIAPCLHPQRNRSGSFQALFKTLTSL
jgi:hypothetical protein